MGVVFVIGLLFGCFGALAAFVIVYDEYRKHGLTRRQLLGKSFRTSVLAFVVLLFLALAIGSLILYLGP